MYYKHISTAVENAAQYIEGRRDGTIKSVPLPHKKLNKMLMGGVEWNKIFSIMGASGSGKSAILEQWKHGMIKEADESIKVLSFEFEMLAIDQVARNISSNLNKTVSNIYSAESPLSDNDMGLVYNQLDVIKKSPIYYVDDFCTVSEIKSTVVDFAKSDLENDEALIVTIDHILLTKGVQNQQELHIIRDLYNTCIELKKWFESKNRKILIFLIGQLNRNIEQTDRIINNKLHYPNKADIFGSSYAYYSSDYVLITHKPSLIPGIDAYGPPIKTADKTYPRGLPIKNEDGTPFIYWHLIKNRSGQTCVLHMVDQLKFSKVTEYNE